MKVSQLFLFLNPYVTLEFYKINIFFKEGVTNEKEIFIDNSINICYGIGVTDGCMWQWR